MNQELKGRIGTLTAWTQAFVTLSVIILVFNFSYGVLVVINDLAQANTDLSPALITTAIGINFFDKYIFTPLIGVVIVIAGVILYGFLISIQKDIKKEVK